MLYLSGALRPEWIGLPKLGFMFSPNIGNRLPHIGPWAADNGCFTTKVRFDLGRYLSWLTARKYAQDRCLFATAPDVVGDAVETWRRSSHVLPIIRNLGYKAALCAQDGLDPDTVEWDTFDCLFVGGSTQFKLAESTYALVAEAKRRGKWCHMGRVNGGARFVAAAQAGYDSVDGTFLAFAPTVNLPRLQQWQRRVEEQPCLF